MKKSNRLKRNKLWYKIWEDNRSEYSMQELSLFLKVPLTTFWDVIQRIKGCKKTNRK